MRFLIAVLVSLFSLSALAQSVPAPALAANAWVLVDHATVDEVAGARATLVGLVVVFVVAAVTAVPALAWLYVLVNSHRWSADERPGDRPEEPRDERAGA